MSEFDQDLYFMQRETEKNEEIEKKNNLRNILFKAKDDGYNSINNERCLLIKVFVGFLMSKGKFKESEEKLIELIAENKEREYIIDRLNNNYV